MTFVEVRKVSLATGLAVLTVRYQDNVDHSPDLSRFRVNGIREDLNGDRSGTLNTGHEPTG